MKIKVVIDLDDEVAREFVQRRFGDTGKRLEDVKWSIRTWAAVEITKMIST